MPVQLTDTRIASAVAPSAFSFLRSVPDQSYLVNAGERHIISTVRGLLTCTDALTAEPDAALDTNLGEQLIIETVRGLLAADGSTDANSDIDAWYLIKGEVENRLGGEPADGGATNPLLKNAVDSILAYVLDARSRHAARL